jgi:hypothetical protein
MSDRGRRLKPTTRARRTARAVMLALLLTLAAVGTAGAQASASEDSVKTDLAQRILVASKAAEVFLQALTVNLPAQRAAAPGVPAAFWDTLMARATARADELVLRLAPAFTENYSLDELRGLLGFYESPIGRAMVAKQGAVMQRSAEIGEQWGVELGMSLAQEFLQSGKMKPDPTGGR